ncbi:MAG: nucleoside triphosphate pyrophosphohydrolase [Proteobacteria bacterium]|nr:nucleoside triphosphate pyrophosphohydrolase [Pseudomonadota bacterium]
MGKKRSNREDQNFENLIKLIETLRGTNGCPWDQKQTPKTMAVYLLEEVYELVDAIESENFDEICEELGDVLFHIIFIARLFEEKKSFGIDDVVKQITEKMVRRHPHVFGQESAEDSSVLRNRWHKIKKNEKNHAKIEATLDSVPGKLPALMRAYRISERAARTGFDWDNISDVMKKAEEEWHEFQCALNENSDDNKKENIALEFGDILFTLVNVARFAAIHPETALKESIKKFETRFRTMEKMATQSGRDIDSLSRNEFDTMWETVKSSEE